MYLFHWSFYVALLQEWKRRIHFYSVNLLLNVRNLDSLKSFDLVSFFSMYLYYIQLYYNFSHDHIEGTKYMRFATSSEGSQLVRIVVPWALMNIHRHRDAFLNEQRGLFLVTPINSLVDLMTVRMSPLHNLSTEIQQLLLACREGCGLCNNS